MPEEVLELLLVRHAVHQDGRVAVLVEADNVALQVGHHVPFRCRGIGVRGSVVDGTPLGEDGSRLSASPRQGAENGPVHPDAVVAATFCFPSGAILSVRKISAVMAWLAMYPSGRTKIGRGTRGGLMGVLNTSG